MVTDCTLVQQDSSNLQHEICDEDNLELIEQEKKKFDRQKNETIIEKIADAIVGNIQEMKSFIGLILILAFAVLFYGLMFTLGLLGISSH